MELEGHRIDDLLPGPQGRFLLAYLAMHRTRPVGKAQLAEVLWPGERPEGAETTFRGLVFRLRKAVGSDRLQGKSELQLDLPADARIDVEDARGALHSAESSVALGRWKEAWLPSRIALSIAESEFMAGHEGGWVDEIRGDLADVRLRALDCIAETGLELGGPELAATVRAARKLEKLDPYRESGYRYLMLAHARNDEVAEALRAYERIRCLLRDELGIPPGRRLQDLHRRLVSRQEA